MNLRLLFAMTLALAACEPSRVVGPKTKGPTIAVITLQPGQDLQLSDDACWGRDTDPAVIETVTEQIIVRDEIRDSFGNITRPASYKVNTHQRMVKDSREVWFRTPCPDLQTVTFIATLQRALKARALYLDEITGTMNPETDEALRRFQADRGLDSPVLSLAAAQELGLLATETSKL